MGTGSSQGSNGGDQNGTFGTGGNPWHASVREAHLHLAVSTGARASERVLFYGGAAYGKSWRRSEIDQTTEPTVPGGNYKSNDSGQASTSTLFILFNLTHVQLYVSGE